MHRRCRWLLALTAFAICLPLSAPGDPAPGETAAPEASSSDLVYATTGKIERVRPDSIAVRRMGRTTQPNAPALQVISGGMTTPVGGEGKTSWSALRKGDLVVVSYRLDPTPQAAKVMVLPPTAHPAVAAALGVTPAKLKGRVFSGWIKYKDQTTLVVRTPDRPPPQYRPGQTQTFVRQEGTKVELHRSSWDELKKGDRVMIHYQKGNPRPADVIKVVLRGGEKPLPPGLATRLYDPVYDTSVQDVDGIGEIPPDQTWQPPPPRPTPPASD